MRIFVIGKTAREHALIEQIAKSPRCKEIFCAPANPAIAEFATCVNITMDDLTSMAEFAKENLVDLTIVMDEDLIAKGISNLFKAEGLRIFAPTQEAAQLGTSRAFAKKFLYKLKAPITKYGVFDKENSAVDFAKKAQFPIKITFDYICETESFLCKTFHQAKETLSQIFSYGTRRVIIEEYAEGEEFNITILTDGYQVLPLPYVKKENDKAYTPVAQITSAIENDIAQNIIFPIIDALQNQGLSYEGFLSLRFLLQNNEQIIALEVQPTISIPEATCIFQLIKDDLLDIIFIATEGALEDCYQNIYTSDDAVVSKLLIAPKEYSKVVGIENLDAENIELFYNKVGMNTNYEIITNDKDAFYMTAKASTITRAEQLLEENKNIVEFIQT